MHKQQTDVPVKDWFSFLNNCLFTNTTEWLGVICNQRKKIYIRTGAHRGESKIFHRSGLLYFEALKSKRLTTIEFDDDQIETITRLKRGSAMY
jgi:hypothetical protein